MINKIVYPGYQELSLETARQIAGIIEAKPGALLCFPAGDTSLGTFAELVKMRNNGNIDFSQCKIVGLDEWVHLGKMKVKNCFHFLKKHLFDLIGIKSGQMCFFDGETDDLKHECFITDQFIKTNGGIDMMLLGVGMNGHIGLNEPGTSFDNYSHVVNLDKVTKKVAQKYFSENASLSRGITLGMKHVMETRTVILQLSGLKKSPIVKKLLKTEVTEDFPVSIVKTHPNAFVLMDQSASQG